MNLNLNIGFIIGFILEYCLTEKNCLCLALENNHSQISLIGTHRVVIHLSPLSDCPNESK